MKNVELLITGDLPGKNVNLDRSKWKEHAQPGNLVQPVCVNACLYKVGIEKVCSNPIRCPEFPFTRILFSALAFKEFSQAAKQIAYYMLYAFIIYFLEFQTRFLESLKIPRYNLCSTVSAFSSMTRHVLDRNDW